MKKITSNPYIVGNPIKTKEMFFGREDDFLFIERKIGAGKANQVIILCGERRSGKTSILFQILSGRLGDQFVPVLVDMQILAGIRSDLDFFKAIVETGRDQLAVPESAFAEIGKRAAGGNVEGMFEGFLSVVGRLHPDKVVLFLLDEYELLEAKIREGILSESVVHYLSGILEGSHRVSFIFTGSTNLENRKVDFWKSLLGKSIYRKISYLSAEDTRRLITEPLKGSVGYTEALVSSIYRLSGGQPFYVQVICQNLIDILMEEDRNDPSGEDLEAVVKDIIENPLPQMIYSWNSLTDWTKFTLSSLAGNLSDSGETSDTAAVYRYLTGSKIALPFKRERLNVFLEEAYEKELLRKDDRGAYSFRMDLYRRWIRKEHSIWKVIKEVNLEVKKQRAALRWLIPAGAALATGLAVLLFFLLGRGPERISGITAKANQAPFRMTIDGSLPLTSEGKSDLTRIALPPLEVGEHRFSAVNPVTGEEVVFSLEVTAAITEIKVAFSKDVAAHTFGSLFLQTVPEGALIRIDGKNYGTTPKVVGELVAGAHQVEFIRQGYKKYSYQARVRENEITEQKIALEPAYGALVLNIRPTAKVYLDGGYLVDTPIAKPLVVPTGTHTLLVVNESLGVKEEIAITVRENETTKIERSY